MAAHQGLSSNDPLVRKDNVVGLPSDHGSRSQIMVAEGVYKDFLRVFIRAESKLGLAWAKKREF